MLDELQCSSRKCTIIYSLLSRVHVGTCLRLVEVTGVPDPTPFSITVRMHVRTGWNFLSFPGQLQLGMDLQPKLSLRRQLMGLSLKYNESNDLGWGRDMVWYACPWRLIVNSLNWGGFVKDLYCYLLFFLSNLCATPTPSSAIMVRHDRVQYREKQRPLYLTLWDEMSQTLAYLEANSHKVFQISQNFQAILQHIWWRNKHTVHFAVFIMFTTSFMYTLK